MSVEVLSGIAVWKWIGGAGASIAGFFGMTWVHAVNKKLQGTVTREELSEHLDSVVAAIKAEADKNKAETEKLFLQLQVESLREIYQNKDR